MQFEDFVAARGQALLRLAYVTLGESVTAEDVTQTVLARLYERWSRIEHPYTYARRAVMNECVDRHRRMGREVLVSHEVLGDIPRERSSRGGSPSADDWIPRDALWRAVVSLPPRQRAVLVLRYYEGLSDSEIAELLGIRDGTVRSSAARALAKLRALREETLQ